MTALHLFDAAVRTALLPLTYARPVGDLRVGSLTIAEKWARRQDRPVRFLAQDYLRPLFPPAPEAWNILLDGSVLPSLELLSFLDELETGTAYYLDDQLLLAYVDRATVTHFLTSGELPGVNRREMPHLPLSRIQWPADIFSRNGEALREDFELLTVGRSSAKVSGTNLVIGPLDQLFLEEGVTLEGCTINCTDGPVYFGTGATVLEGSLLRGPLAVNAGAVVKMGAKIYGSTTIGPHCKVGGEINNVVFQANSNKGHDGFLGNAVIGEWCNLGADTNASNLKNDYGEVKVWSYAHDGRRPSGLQFHGLIMGDHSKAGINTMFNTGTVVGFCASIFGAGFQPSFLPSFTWGGVEGMQTYRLDKALATAERVLQRRGGTMRPEEATVFEEIFNRSQKYRSW